MGQSFKDKSIIISGGCGFIGSHIVDKLSKFNPSLITVIDDLSAGTNTSYLDPHLKYNQAKFLQFDIRDKSKIISALENHDMIIHLAAQPSVPVSVAQPDYDFDVNIIGSMNLLEAARQNDIHEFVFAASGGTVYGEASVFPTPETQALNPISNYGAAKAAFEKYMQSYSFLYGMKCTSLRFGNVFGRRSLHGVIHDLFVKLQKNPNELEILGDGTQTKSYLHIDDCVDGFIMASQRKSSGFEAYNMAADPPINVAEIADLICKEVNLNPKYNYTGGSRGWKGDVKYGELDCKKLKSLGWSQKIKFKDGLKSYIKWLKEYYS